MKERALLAYAQATEEAGDDEGMLYCCYALLFYGNRQHTERLSVRRLPETMYLAYWRTAKRLACSKTSDDGVLTL